MLLTILCLGYGPLIQYRVGQVVKGPVPEEALTGKLNELVKTFNGHTHQGVHGPTGKPLTEAKEFSRGDYEDEFVTH